MGMHPVKSFAAGGVSSSAYSPGIPGTNRCSGCSIASLSCNADLTLKKPESGCSGPAPTPVPGKSVALKISQLAPLANALGRVRDAKTTRVARRRGFAPTRPEVRLFWV